MFEIVSTLVTYQTTVFDGTPSPLAATVAAAVMVVFVIVSIQYGHNVPEQFAGVNITY